MAAAPITTSQDRYDAHRRAVSALRRRFAALPPGAPVRLAKKTSNLFRFRPPATGPTLATDPFDPNITSLEKVAMVRRGHPSPPAHLRRATPSP